MSLATRRPKNQGKDLLMGTSPAPPKEGSTSLERLLRKQNEFVYKLITLIYSKIFYDILRCRLRRGEPKPQGGRLLMETSPAPSQGGEY